MNTDDLHPDSVRGGTSPTDGDSFTISEPEGREALVTAYALGELDAAEKAEAERLIADPTRAGGQRQVLEVRALAAALRAGIDEESPARSGTLRQAVLAAVTRPEPSRQRPRGRGWMLLVGALAASLLVAFLLPTVQHGGRQPRERLVADAGNAAPAAPQPAPQSAPAASAAAAPGPSMGPAMGPAIRRAAAEDREASTEKQMRVADNPSVPPQNEPLSTFSIDADTTSYTEVRRFLDSGQLPPREAVGIEELLNYFPYDYRQPDGHVPFSVTVDAAECPWNRGHRLVRIGLQGRTVDHDTRQPPVERLSQSTVAIAKDVRIQVEFNPAQVRSYRLLGSENRALATMDFRDDTKDAGEIGAGHRVTVLYEVGLADEGADGGGLEPLEYQPQAAVKQPAGDAADDPAVRRELLMVKLCWKLPAESENSGLEVPLSDRGPAFADAPADLRFAAAVAAFGMILRNSDQKGDASLPMVATIAGGALGRDEGGYRAEFLDLVRKAESLRSR